jgi:hypothetical protein
MTNRERFHAVMNFQPVDRLPLVEWANWWDLTIDRWWGEGLPRSHSRPYDLFSDRYEIFDHFGLEQYKQGFDQVLPPDFIWPEHGQPVITSEADYERLRPRLFPGMQPADRRRWQAWAEEQQRGDAVVWVTLWGYFMFPRFLFGVEPHLFAFYDQPELMHRINTDLTDYHLRFLDELCAICTPDFMSFAEDLSYNHGPMLSKPLFDEFLAPYHRKITARLRELGILAFVDSDGDVAEPIDWFAEVGIEGILPLERQSGVDVAKLQGKHPRMRFIGGFDKLTMNKGEAAMRAEFERLLPSARHGGYIISCDHQTPPGVSYDQYQRYLRLFREYAAAAASGGN